MIWTLGWTLGDVAAVFGFFYVVQRLLIKCKLYPYNYGCCNENANNNYNS